MIKESQSLLEHLNVILNKFYIYKGDGQMNPISMHNLNEIFFVTRTSPRLNLT